MGRDQVRSLAMDLFLVVLLGMLALTAGWLVWIFVYMPLWGAVFSRYDRRRARRNLR